MNPDTNKLETAAECAQAMAEDRRYPEEGEMRGRILVVDGEDMVRRACARILAGSHTVLEAAILRDAEALLGAQNVDVCLLGVRLPDGDALERLELLRRLSPSTVFVFMTGHGGLESAVAAVKEGAYDFLAKPFESIEKVSIAVFKALRHKELRDRAERLEAELARVRTSSSAGSAGVASTFKEARERATSRFEEEYVSTLLQMTGGNMAKASRIAGLDRSNFRKMVLRAGVDYRDFVSRRRGPEMTASAA